MKKKNKLQMLAALLAATLSMALASPIATKANEEYNVDTTKESNADTGRIYYLKNSHGDVIGQMDENGNLLTSYAYNAFGEQISAVAIQEEQKSTTNRFLYAGEQYDETSGLYYLRARHYDVRAGRFTQEDTYLGDGRNLYAYVHSNPLKYVDPTGHDSVKTFDPDGSSWEEKIKHESGGRSQSGSYTEVHGNSKLSTKTQHGYEIYNTQTGDVVKTGISGQKLNLNGTSPRANSQVNKLNTSMGMQIYDSRIIETDMLNRYGALEWERENALRLWNEGNSMSLHKRPKPWEE